MTETFLGDLSQVKLFDILKPLFIGKKIGRVLIKGKEDSGELYLEMGDIVHAKTTHSVGEYGFFKIMGWRVGRVTFESDIFPPEKTISIPTEQLLLNWSSVKQEWEKFSETISSLNLMFRLSVQNNGAEINISADQWNLLALSNGMRSLTEIAKMLHWDEFKALKTTYHLVRAGLLTQVGDQTLPKKRLVGENFFLVIENELKKVVGAVSPFIIDDKLTEFGETKDAFPRDQALSFVEALGDEIPNEPRRKEFRRAVMEFISLEK